jgi:hypothetical protein
MLPQAGRFLLVAAKKNQHEKWENCRNHFSIFSNRLWM